MPLAPLKPVAVNIAILIPFGVIFALAWFGVSHILRRSTTFEHPRLEGEQIAAPGSVISISYDVTRYSSCTIEINRIAEYQEPGLQFRRQWLLQAVVQTFQGDDVTRPSGYKVQLDPSMPDGRYDVFSRVRYYCDALDYIWPRVIDMPRVRLVVSSQAK